MGSTAASLCATMGPTSHLIREYNVYFLHFKQFHLQHVGEEWKKQDVSDHHRKNMQHRGINAAKNATHMLTKEEFFGQKMFVVPTKKVEKENSGIYINLI